MSPRKAENKGVHTMIEPKNELELIIRFAQEAKEIGFEIISCDGKFPDGIVSYENKEYRVEFEYKSNNFWLHKHNPLECDLIICWIDDDDFSVLPVLELSNPDWIDHGIEKIPAIERTASYWKRRALEAEAQNIEKSNTDRVVNGEIPPFLDIPNFVYEEVGVKAKEIRKLFYVDKMTKTAISQELGYKEYSGTIVKRINRALKDQQAMEDEGYKV